MVDPRVATTEISEARSDDDFAAARDLFGRYAREIGIDLAFQGFSAELENLRTMYASPRGCLLLGRVGARPIAVVGMRPFDAETAEMKRLYVLPQGRRTGLGRRLARAVVARARQGGYQRLVLDTLRSMEPANALYRSLGFTEIPPYYANPLPDVVYFELRW